MFLRLSLAVFLSSAQIALAQSGNAVGSGLGNNADTMTGANLDTMNGTNANGTPMAQSPGASMTVGAGNSTMLPGISGGTATPPGLPPPKIVHGTENGNVNAQTSVKPTQ